MTTSGSGCSESIEPSSTSLINESWSIVQENKCQIFKQYGMNLFDTIAQSNDKKWEFKSSNRRKLIINNK